MARSGDVGGIEDVLQSQDTVKLDTLDENKVSLYILCLSVWVSICLYPKNVKTDEAIGPNFCLGPHMTTGKVFR